jgi:imidazolonepropionase-like amidohydrolase
MTRTTVLFLTLLFIARTTAAADLLVTHATIWGDTGPRENREILIRDGVVAVEARAGTTKRRGDLRVLDARGDTLLPGLIDAHVHLVSGVRLPDDFGALDRARVAARQLLRSGVTSGRIHLWGLEDATAYLREARGHDYPAPRLVAGGPGLFGGQPDWYADNGNAWGIRSAEDAALKLERLRNAGVRWVTLHDLDKFKPGEVAAIVFKAHQLGLRVGAAGDSLAGATLGVAAGADSIEYLERSDAPQYPDSLIAAMRARGEKLFLVPAIGFPYRYSAYRQGEMKLDDPGLTEFLPAAIAQFAAAALDHDQDKPIRWAPTWTEVPASYGPKFQQLQRAGLQVVTGTDCGSPVHVQSDSIWWELETWRRLGIPPGDILRAATALPAKLLGDVRAGHLGRGAHGDFVLLRGRFDEGPLSVDRVRAVARGGELFVDEGRWIGPK